MSMTQIKICGIKDPDLAYQTAKLGAQYIGIVAEKSSKRYAPPPLMKAICDAVKDIDSIPVIVFSNSTQDEILKLCRFCNVKTVQLHGLSREAYPFLPADFQKIYVKVVNKAGSIEEDANEKKYPLNKERDFILFDNAKAGSGECFDLHQLKNEKGYNYFLSGGLTPKNVREKIEILQPYGVDVSSGVESFPGEKDKFLIQQFIEAVKQCH